MTYAGWLEVDAREKRDRERIAKTLKKGRTLEWIHEEDEYPMGLILEVKNTLLTECEWSLI